jgi:dTDP-glucose 4,6-dehydratase
MRHQDAVVHFAAESHVDRSILNSAEFVSANVLGTHVLLDAAHRLEVPIFVQISTDEVYGSLNPLDPAFREDTPLAPRSPYAASKAAADLLVQSYHATYGMDVRITRCSNNYGPYQFPEKLLPLAILNARRGIQIPVYGDGRQRRDWIHVEDHCRAILAVLEHGKPGQVYNVGAGQETDNLAAVRSVIRLVGASEDLMTFVGDRPGHDRRYAMDARKITSELGWKPRYRFDEGLAETVAWYQANEVWWRPLLGQEYAAYYQTQYGGR